MMKIIYKQIDKILLCSGRFCEPHKLWYDKGRRRKSADTANGSRHPSRTEYHVHGSDEMRESRTSREDGASCRVFIFTIPRHIKILDCYNFNCNNTGSKRIGQL